MVETGQGATPGSGQQDQPEPVFHPNSPMARLAQLGIIGRVHIAPPVSGSPQGSPSVGGGATEAGPEAVSIETFVANLGASLTLAQLSLGRAPAGPGMPNIPAFQLRSMTLNLNAQVEWGADGSISMRPPAPTGEPKTLPASTLTVSFDPFPLAPSIAAKSGG